MRLSIAILTGLSMLGCTATGGDSAAVSHDAWDGTVSVHGALRAMFHEGQTGTMVTLDTMLPDSDLYAVGALSGLSGEITVVEGTAYLSYPDGEQEARTDVTSQSDAGATLLVAADVPAWRSVTLESPILFDAIDASIGRLAAASGMSLDNRFPFLLEGEFENLEWHVIDGSQLAAGGTSHQDHLAASTQTSRDRTTATLIGFYSASDQGVFTHMGSKTHMHCVLDGPLASGHVDHVTIPAGTIIKFPVVASEQAGASRH